MGFWGGLGRKCNFGGDHPLFSISQSCAVPVSPFYSHCPQLAKGVGCVGSGAEASRRPWGFVPPPQECRGYCKGAAPQGWGPHTQPHWCIFLLPLLTKDSKKAILGDLCVLPVWVAWTNLSRCSPKGLVPKPWRATAKQQTCSGMRRVPCRARPTCSHAVRRVNINSNRWL